MPYSHLDRSHHIFPRHGDLHVVATYYNPMRYQSRLFLFREFVRRAADAGAKVYVNETAFGRRPFEVGDGHGQVGHFRFRSEHELWLKENSINVSVGRLPDDAQYIACVDGDVAFTRPSWVQETIQQLQHFPLVQMWRTAIDLDPNDEPLAEFKSFAACAIEDPNSNPAWQKPAKGAKRRDHSPYYATFSGGYYHPAPTGKPTKLYWHPGYAWAYRREAWDQIGGLLDINIVGGGDHQMAHGLYGHAAVAIPFVCTPGYRKAVMAWQTNAMELKRNVGFVPGTLLHYWHGKKIKRGYWDRWKILAENDYDPVTDLRRDWQGLFQLAGNKPKLRDDLRRYFRSRQEDSIDVE